MKVEIWSDVVCPWCYVGKRRFEEALADFEHRDQVEVLWRSFELDPSAPRSRTAAYADHLAGKYGMGVVEAQGMIDHMVEVGDRNGLALNFGIARPGNTFDAHRLLHLAAERGVQDALKERFLAATFTEGAAIGEVDELARLAVEVGLDGDEVGAVLAGDRYSAEVRGDEQRARAFGVSGVPFFVMGGRYGVSGAQPSDLLLQVLRDTWSETEHPLASVGGSDAASCTNDACVVPS